MVSDFLVLPATGGYPVCPVCGSSLTYVEKTVVRSEFPVTTMSADIDSVTGEVLFLFPAYASEEEESLTTEVLSRQVGCSRAGCGYFVPDNYLGEIVPD